MEDDKAEAGAVWLSAIAKSIAYLCLKSAEAEGKFKSLLDRVDFIEAIGLPTTDAAKVCGSTKASVDEIRRRLGRKKKAVKNGKGAKARRSR
jgi:hypothetical protein